MASIKAILYKSKTYSDGTHPIVMQVIHNRKARKISLNHSLSEIEWDSKSGLPKKGVKNYRELSTLIRSKIVEAEKALMLLQMKKEVFGVDELMNQIKGAQSKTTFNQFSERCIASDRKSNRIGNADSYQSALTALLKFTNGDDIMFQDIDYKFLKRFEEFYLSKEGNSINGFNVYLRSIRAIFNKAIKEGLVSADLYPFRDYKIKQEKTLRRAITSTEMRQIVALELDEGTPLWHTRNYFLFSFYTIGMSWIDMAKLKVKDLSSGRIYYKRSKTKKEYNIRINDNIKEILNFYTAGKTANDYVFPIIHRKKPADQRKDIKNELKNYNKRLKEIGRLIGSSSKITSYVSRHSWASIANFAGTPLGIIQQGMGHENAKITQEYLKDFDTADVDAVNENILKL